MTLEHEDFRKLPDVTSALGRWYSLPPQIRHRLEADGIRRYEQDVAYLESIGRNFEDLPVGTILPSGNKVIEDEEGRRIRRAPVSDYLPIANNN